MGYKSLNHLVDHRPSKIYASSKSTFSVQHTFLGHFRIGLIKFPIPSFKQLQIKISFQTTEFFPRAHRDLVSPVRYGPFLKNEYFVWMNILDFKKMNILIEWIFWIFVKWMIFWTNTLGLVCRRQKWLLPNVSKSSEIIQGSIVGPNSVHFRGSFTYTGASGGLQSHILALFWNFE